MKTKSSAMTAHEYSQLVNLIANLVPSQCKVYASRVPSAVVPNTIEPTLRDKEKKLTKDVMEKLNDWYDPKRHKPVF